MPDEDPTLDAALAALAGVQPKDLEDDERWAKRVASRVSTFAPPSRRELDPFLAAPFPDDHQDFDHSGQAADDHDLHGTSAAAAADFGDARGWEGSMSDDDSSRPPNSLSDLSGLTRTGSTSIEPVDGAAKGEDSGLIDLRAMSQPEPEAAAPIEASAAAPIAASEKAAPISLKGETAAAAPRPPLVATTSPGAAIPPSSTTATAASAPRTAPPSEKKKGGAVIWVAFGGLAAAAAAAFFVMGPMAKKDEATTASAPAAAPAEDKKKADDEKVAAVEKPAATTEPAPQASAAPTAIEEPQHGGTAAKPGAAPTGTAATKAGPVDPKAATKPTAAPSSTAEAPKSAGTGSLDEVLGIGKDQPTKTATPTDNLPDKPDSMDVRSAINSRVGTASACVKGLDGPSSVAVTFGPAGAVSGVAVSSGPAKGTGAESCIKNAFASAKVPPSKKGATGSATLVP